MAEKHPSPKDGAEALLLSMKENGVAYLFANAGTDFPPIIEAYASLPPDQVPEPVTVPHETAAMAMAHGYYLASGQTQAVMVHVNVGLANAVMGAINAASDNVPVLLMSGRTPITETGRKGARATPIQYGQEMYDQSGMVRDLVKYTYEMRYPEQGYALVSRALAIANSAPSGPVYLSLPREPLGDPIARPDQVRIAPQPAVSPAAPDRASLAQLASWLKQAQSPLLLCQRGDPQGRLARAVSDICRTWGIAVIEPFSVRNLLASSDPVLAGYLATEKIAAADVILVLDSDVPWIELNQAPPETCRIVHLGPDPLFTRMPMRSYRSDLNIAADPLAAIEGLAEMMGPAKPACQTRFKQLQQEAEQRRSRAKDRADQGAGKPMSAEWISQCVSDIMDDQAIAFSELCFLPGFMNLAGPNRLFGNAHAGGLGWALPAALGAQLVDRDRLVIAGMGDGSYMFANPVACHQIAEALALPVLTIIKNNASWNAVRRSVLRGYPDGAAVRANQMALTSLTPVPDFRQVAAASNAHAEQVDDGAALPAALARALTIIREEKRQVLLDLTTALSDQH